jgi:hypothetical protein
MPRPETHNEQPIIPPPQPPQTSRQKAHRRTSASGSYPLKSALRKAAAAAAEDPQPANSTLSRANALTRSRTYSNPTNPVIGTDLAFRPRSCPLVIYSL